jgi:hypothetical protein
VDVPGCFPETFSLYAPDQTIARLSFVTHMPAVKKSCAVSLPLSVDVIQLWESSPGEAHPEQQDKNSEGKCDDHSAICGRTVSSRREYPETLLFLDPVGFPAWRVLEPQTCMVQGTQHWEIHTWNHRECFHPSRLLWWAHHTRYATPPFRRVVTPNS